MASVSMSGYLRDPLGEFSDKDKILFKHQTTTGTVLAGSVSVFDVDETGYYDIEVGYGNVQIMSRNRYDCRWYSHGVFTINSDTTADNLPTLLNATTPLSDPEILEVEALLQDAADYANAAEAAQAAAEAAQAATEALFDTGFDSNVATSVGLAATPYPDLHIPFNDGLRIESGYGTNDQIDVSAAQDGSVMVDLPSMSVDFTRSTGCYYLNKNKSLSYASIDEPCISSDGLWVHPSFTVWSNYSNLITNSFWAKTNMTATDSGETVLGGYPVYNVQLTSDSGFRRFYVNATSYYTKGEYVSVTMIARAGSISNVILGVGGGSQVTFNLSDGTYTDSLGTAFNASITPIGDGFYLCFMSYLTSDSDADQLVRCPSVSGSTGDDFDIAMINLSNSKYPHPPQYNESSSVLVSQAGATTKNEGNLNYAGGDLTSEVDFRLFLGSSSFISNFELGVWLTGQSTLSSGGATISTSSLSDYVGELIKVVTTYESSTGDVKIYINGDLKGQASSQTMTRLSEIYLGRWSGNDFHSCSPIKSFKIYHSTLTADQVKALGVAQ